MRKTACRKFTDEFKEEAVKLVMEQGYKISEAAREKERAKPIPRVRSIHQESKATSGSRRIARELNAFGFHCGKLKAGTLMKLAGVAAKQRKKFKATTDSKHTFPVAPKMLPGSRNALGCWQRRCGILA